MQNDKLIFFKWRDESNDKKIYDLKRFLKQLELLKNTYIEGINFETSTCYLDRNTSHKAFLSFDIVKGKLLNSYKDNDFKALEDLIFKNFVLPIIFENSVPTILKMTIPLDDEELVKQLENYFEWRPGTLQKTEPFDTVPFEDKSLDRSSSFSM